MRNIFKRALAVLASTAMCGSMLLYYPSGTFEAFQLDLRAQAAEGIAISEENFPDDMFRSYVNGYINRNADGVLTLDEILNVKEMCVENMGIADLTGVEYFTELTHLFCYGNTLTTLDVSANTALEYLNCTDNALTSIDVSANTALTKLYCEGNPLASES
ncbi:MAG: leucine-rich repeat domain-containing protein [Ruminococcus sp.]|nr:leucine-rich repeat domain-containing protein [Ruminococcus sp.]